MSNVTEGNQENSRDQLWHLTFDLYYDAYYEELLTYYLCGRWTNIDIVVRTLIIITASGSTISGWVLWTQPGFKILWACISGLTAFLSILFLTTGVTEKVKKYTKSYTKFLTLRNRIFQFRNDIAIFPNFPVIEKNKELSEFRKEYTDICSEFNYDFFKTKKLENSTQDEINNRLSDIILKEK